MRESNHRTLLSRNISAPPSVFAAGVTHFSFDVFPCLLAIDFIFVRLLVHGDVCSLVQLSYMTPCTDVSPLPFPRASYYLDGASGDAALRAAKARGGPSASRILAKLHSDLMSQFLKLFVPYVQGLTEAVESGGVS